MTQIGTSGGMGRAPCIVLTTNSAPFPPGDPPIPSDVLSDELDRFSRDPVYEAAVLAAVE